MIHPARTMEFRELHDSLMEACAAGLVRECRGDDGLRLYCYTQSAVYDRAWSPVTLMARGLILDLDNCRVVATPYQKFFNVGEATHSIPDLPFEVFCKIDGSLIIIFHHAGKWRTATKGSLNSEQAQWAARLLGGCDLTALVPGCTYLSEAIYPENRIVVRYEHTGLVLLGAYNEDGTEFDYAGLLRLSDNLGWRIAARYDYQSVSDLVARAKDLPPTEEGFVLRFANGLRLKVKGDEYCRIHALISRCTPLAMWEVMQAGDDLTSIRRDLPEEFWSDFDGITAALSKNRDELVERINREAAAVAHLSDKEVGLRLDQFPADVRSFIFPWRKSGGDLLAGKSRHALFRAIRPTANILPGYIPSYAIGRVLEDAA